jgi:hypothetical protein
MRADLVVYSILLVLGLGAAYYSTLPSDSGEESKVKILAIEPQNIADITFLSEQADPKITIEVSAKKRSEDDRFFIDFKKTETPKAKKADETPPPKVHDPLSDDSKDEGDKSKSSEEPKPGNTEPSPAQPIVTSDQFLGNEQMEELLKSLNPFVASRTFTQVDEKQLEEFGLKTPTQKITITTNDGKKQVFSLGRKSYGSSQRFILEESTGGGGNRVLLVEDTIFGQLENANKRLFDRRFMADNFELVTKAEVKTSTGIQKKLSHTQKNKDGDLLWTDDEPDAPAKPSYDSFMDRIEKLRLSKYASAELEATLKTTAPFLSITLEKDSKVLDTVEFKKIVSQDNKTQFFVTSQFLKSHGEIQASRIETIEKDLDTVFKSK